MTSSVCLTPSGIFSFRKISTSVLIPFSIKLYLSGRSSTDGCSTILLLSASENSDSFGLILLTKSMNESFFSSLSVSQVIAIYRSAPASEMCSASSEESPIRFSKHPEQLSFLSCSSITKGSRLSQLVASKSSGTYFRDIIETSFLYRFWPHRQRSFLSSPLGALPLIRRSFNIFSYLIKIGMFRVLLFNPTGSAEPLFLMV